MDNCEMCAHYVSDEEFGDYCSINLDEDEMERFLTQSVKSCHYFQLSVKDLTIWQRRHGKCIMPKITTGWLLLTTRK